MDRGGGDDVPDVPAAPPGHTIVTVPSTPTVLAYGMQSEAVRQLQVKLGNLPTTGYFGSQTKARVIEYQRFAGLRTDRGGRPQDPGDPQPAGLAHRFGRLPVPVLRHDLELP